MIQPSIPPPSFRRVAPVPATVPADPATQSMWLDAIRIVDMPELPGVTDASSIVGEHSGSGRFTAPNLKAYVGADYLPLVGGELTGPLNIDGNSGANQLTIGPWTETSTAGPYGADLLIQRNYDVVGGPVVTPGSIIVQTVVEGAPSIFVWPIQSLLYLRTLGASDGHTPEGEPTGQHVAIESAIRREHGPSIAFNYHGQIIDSTGLVQGSTASICCEYDIQANGPEDPSTGYNPGAGARVFLSLGPTAYPAAAWQVSHAYAVDDVVQPVPGNGHVYVCSEAGTSGASQPVWPTSADVVTDGTVTWQYGTTHAMQVSRAISFGGSGSGAYPASYGAGLYADRSWFYDAVIDISTAVLVDGGVKDAGIRLGYGMPIDFSGNGTDAGQNVRTLRYDGHLSYIATGNRAFSISDAGQVTIGGPPVNPGRQLDVCGSNTVGIALDNGTFTTAVRMAVGQRVSFTFDDSDCLRFVTGQGITVSSGETDVAWVSGNGSLSLQGGLGAFGVTPPTTRPTFTGAKGGNTALASVIAILAACGIGIDGTT